jgi:hypothetical protein
VTLTDELRDELRSLLDEIIPPGGSESDTRFTNTQIDKLLEAASEINEAASNGWRRKALWAMSERGGLQESQAGDEKLKFVSIEAYRDHCLAMMKLFSDMTPGKGSRLLAFDAPDVLGLEVT